MLFSYLSLQLCRCLFIEFMEDGPTRLGCHTFFPLVQVISDHQQTPGLLANWILLVITLCLEPRVDLIVTSWLVCTFNMPREANVTFRLGAGIMLFTWVRCPTAFRLEDLITCRDEKESAPSKIPVLHLFPSGKSNCTLVLPTACAVL